MKLFIKWIASNETLESNIFTANLDKTSVNNLVCFYFVLLNNFVWPLECEYQDLLEYLSIVKLVLKRWPDNQSSCFLQIYYFSVAYLTWKFCILPKGELKMEYKNGMVCFWFYASYFGSLYWLSVGCHEKNISHTLTKNETLEF